MAFLKGHQFLDVSRNHLSGSTPKGLEKLPFLKKLNLSFNDIEGGVPQLQLPLCPVKVMKPRKSLSFKLIIAIVVVILCFFYFHSFLFFFGGKKSKKGFFYCPFCLNNITPSKCVVQNALSSNQWIFSK